MNIVITSAILAFSICYIVDISGAVQKANVALFKRLYGKHIDYNGWYIPLLGCSRCCVWWLLLIYSVFFTNIGIIYSVGNAAFWSYISPIITLLLNRVTTWFSDMLSE